MQFRLTTTVTFLRGAEGRRCDSRTRRLDAPNLLSAAVVGSYLAEAVLGPQIMGAAAIPLGVEVVGLETWSVDAVEELEQ